MNTNSYKQYLISCEENIKEKENIDLSSTDIEDVAYNTFHNINKIKNLASKIRTKFVNNITDNLIIFDKNFSEKGGNVHWCIAYNDFIDKIIKLLNKNKIKKINLFSSSFIEELGLKGALKDNSIHTDNDISENIIFTPKFGIVNTGSLFFEFDSSIDMEQVISSTFKIFILPINDFLLKPEDVEIFSYLYSIYKNKITYPYLSSLYTPNTNYKQSNVHVFIVDNGRSNILANKDVRSTLNCIDCGACKRVCPIYNIVGDKPYDNIFSGPYANVVLPYLENVENYKHLCFSCTGCGNCSKICPVNIPISELIIKNKNYFFENKIMDISDIRLAKSMGKILNNRKLMNQNKFIKNIRIKLLVNNSKLISDKFVFSKYTFNQQYQLKYTNNE